VPADNHDRMHVLAVNCGSSSLKFDLIALGDGDRTLARGSIERIGDASASLDFSAGDGAVREGTDVRDHADATRRALDWLRSLAGDAYAIDAVGHRVVHGGARFSAPVRIDDAVVAAIDDVSALAPLHNAPALAAIRAARDVLGDAVPSVATFDTAFHAAMPDVAARYAIPPELAEKHGIRRYGFHGLAHRSMLERYAATIGRDVRGVKLVTLQLGNGCSAAAIRDGRSGDTSMGLTPLEGLVMGTRSGDVDPSLAGFIARREGIPPDDAEDLLNTRSGLLGLSGRSRDMRDLLKAERDGDARAALAVEMFCYRVRKYVGAYLAALGGADAVVFGGGIGERQPEVRERICAGLEWCGLRLDAARNAAAVGSDARISADGAPLEAYVVRVDEASVIARDTATCLRRVTEGGTP
jgi:acetate kinase